MIYLFYFIYLVQFIATYHIAETWARETQDREVMTWVLIQWIGSVGTEGSRGLEVQGKVHLLCCFAKSSPSKNDC